MEKAHYLGHRQRLKEKYENTRLKGWQDYEILEFILSYSIPRKDTKVLAKSLIEKYKTLSGVLDAEIKDLKTADQISEHSALLIKLFKDISSVYTGQRALGSDVISSPELAISYLGSIMKGNKDEEFYALFLDSSNNLISSKKIHDGVVNKSVIYPRKVVEYALSEKASGVIIAHNHPSGALKPSAEDSKATKAVKDALDTVDISLLDHIIISKNGYFSFKKESLI